MYAILLDGKLAYSYVDIADEEGLLDLPHIVVDKLPDELINIPEGYKCIYEDGTFLHEKMSEKEITPNDRLADLEAENAELWYEIMRKDAHDSEQDIEIATIWYELMTGGSL